MRPFRSATTTVSGRDSSSAGAASEGADIAAAPSAPTGRHVLPSRRPIFSEGVADPQPRCRGGDQLLQPLDAGPLDVIAVAHVPLTVLAALGLLDLRAPQQLLGLRVPAEVDLVQVLVV